MKIFTVMLTLLAIIPFCSTLYIERIEGLGLTVGLSLDTKVKPVKILGESILETRKVELPKPKLVKIKDGLNESILVIPGLDFYEYRRTWTDYKVRFKESVLKALKNDSRSVYMYIYPSLSESYWTSGKRLVTLTRDLKNLTIIAHSRGGLVARVALMYPDFRKKVKKVIFLGTPHFGTPMSDALKIDPDDIEEHFGVSKNEAEILKLSLILSYNAGIPRAPGSIDMSWMDVNLPPLLNYKGIKFIFVAGYIEIESIEDISKFVRNIFKTKTFKSSTGLTYLYLVNEIIAEKRREFSLTDGLVPVWSALALGKLKGEKFVLPGYNHAMLYSDPEILRMALEK